MSDESPKELSPEAQHKQDLGRVQTQIGVTDVRRQVSEILNDILPFGGLPLLARTSFEAHDLNVMVDLATNSNPADLENAGSALWKARDALKDAAKELEDYVGTVEWKGESEIAFRNFGKALVTHARALGGFADTAGTQITVAGTGLASVRHAVQDLRDNRLDRKTVDDVPVPARVEGNAEYDGAMKAEKNRQEAINQMNRLASFYAVSEETLAAQEPPKFDAILKADVPPPTGGWRPPASPPGATATGREGMDTTAPQSLASHADSNGTSGASRVESVGTVAPVPDRNTSMEIDSVATPPAPTTSPSAPPTTTAPGPANPAIGGQVSPMANGFANPVRGGGTARSTGVSGRGPGGANAVGRPGNAETRTPATGRTGGTGPVGRPGPIGSGPAATGRPGAVGPAGQSPMVGRPGSTGQPMAGRAGTSGAGAPRAGRGDGVMGGTPQRSATGAAGSRIPRGTVIGGDGAASGRPAAARPGPSGVVGANPANGAPRSTGRGTPSSNGVVGTPRSGAPGSRPGARGFTAGGTGFVGGRPGQRQSDDEEQERTGSARPDYLMEDEETWAARRRGAVPPVID